MFDSAIALLWQSKEIILVIIVALVLFMVLAIIARING